MKDLVEERRGRCFRGELRNLRFTLLMCGSGDGKVSLRINAESKQDRLCVQIDRLVRGEDGDSGVFGRLRVGGQRLQDVR